MADAVIALETKDHKVHKVARNVAGTCLFVAATCFITHAASELSVTIKNLLGGPFLPSTHLEA